MSEQGKHDKARWALELGSAACVDVPDALVTIGCDDAGIYFQIGSVFSTKWRLTPDQARRISSALARAMRGDV